MSDVAAAAGVAQSTVSRVLNDAPASIPVSDETRDRVRRIARELGYRPHPIARALRGAPTMLLGAVVRDITDLFFAGAVETLSLECKARGYSVVLGHARAIEDEALVMTAVLEARQCDAIMLLGDFTAEHRLVEDLKNGHARVVGLWHGYEHEHPFPTVGVDNPAGTRLALEHLWELGHRRIAYVGPESFGDVKERLDTYREFIGERVGDGAADLVEVAPNSIMSGTAALDSLLARAPDVTALFAATDAVALGLLHAAYERGIRIPDDVSVVGFDDIAMASASVPALTTIRMPVAQIIRRGVELGIGGDSWSGEGAPPKERYEAELVVRSTTAPNARG
jgi:DNA-binding LacI/PurR family transcriptional regulator